MKRTLIYAILFGAAPGLIHASGVIAVSCGGSSALTASTTCSNSATYGSILETFNDDLQWNGASDIISPTLTATNVNDPATANGGFYDTTWDAVGLPLSVTGSDMELADNYVQVKKFSNWVNPTAPHPQIFEGTFDSQPDGSAGSPGDYLIGSGNGSSITIASTTALSDFGFRIESQDYTSFDVVVQLYGIGGAPIGSPLTISNLSGGGLCTNLAASTPIPCNTAPFIQLATSGGVYSFSVYTTQTNSQADTGGFFLDTFYYNPQTITPEPASLLLAGAGLVSMVAFARRRNGRKALGDVGAETIDKA